MTNQEYLTNVTKSWSSLTFNRASIKGLPEANHGTYAQIQLYGLPQGPVEKSVPLMQEASLGFRPEIIFLQLDPMNYMMRQRFMSHKCALNDLEDYDIRGVENLQYPRPFTWQECVVNLITIDMLRANQTHMKIDYTKGVSCYSYPNVQEEKIRENLTPKFIQAITDYIVCDKWSPYFEMNQALYLSLMGKQKVILGDMPEILLRQILGNSLSLEDAKDIFKYVLDQISKANIPITMETATMQYFSHIFLMPRDLYMTALMKETLKAVNSMAAFVGNPHFTPIQRYWIPPPNGINFTQATKIPERIKNETNEMLIEKQALFDVLLDSRAWGKELANPFPYIEEDITKISEKDLKYFKKTFFVNLRKYQAFRDKFIQKEAYLLLEPANSRIHQHLEA